MRARIRTSGIRRAAFLWQFAAIVVLPLWLVTGYAIWGRGLGGFLGISLLAPLLAVGQLALAVLFTARAAVRRVRMLGLADTGVVAVVTVAVAGIGLFTPATAWFGVLALAGVLGGLWLGGRELAADIRIRMRGALADFGLRPDEARPALDAGEYVVVKPSHR